MEQADLVLAVIDLSTSRDEADKELLRGADPARWIVVGNKKDLVRDAAEGLARLSGDLGMAGPAPAGGGRQQGQNMRACAVSALTGEGIDGLRGMIQEIVAGGDVVHLEEPILASERQRVLVDEAAASTGAALAGASRKEDEELVCEDIRMAVQALGRITGEDLTPDLLDEIFSRFCLGK
jgi:tRNA modification GTPase